MLIKDIEPIDKPGINLSEEQTLVYYPDIGSTQAVILRMPVNEETTVEEVESYFSQFALNFKSQIQNETHKSPEEKTDR